MNTFKLPPFYGSEPMPSLERGSAEYANADDKANWIYYFIVELERLGVCLSAVELTVMGNDLWPSSYFSCPIATARELYGER